MTYKWESIGDQDELTRRVCYLGPYLLEHVEEEWIDYRDSKGKTVQKMMMASRIYLWDDQQQIPDLIQELELVEYKRNESYKILEDWYANNVLFDKLFIGGECETNKNKKV